jgi:hypothetical protein
MVVDSLQQQRCFHGRNGSPLTGKEWQECCGISYEYHNDIATRDALALLLELASAAISTEDLARVAELDDALYGLFPAGHDRSQHWWHEALPTGVID